MSHILLYPAQSLQQAMISEVFAAELTDMFSQYNVMFKEFLSKFLHWVRNILSCFFNFGATCPKTWAK